MTSFGTLNFMKIREFRVNYFSALEILNIIYKADLL